MHKIPHQHFKEIELVMSIHYSQKFSFFLFMWKETVMIIDGTSAQLVHDIISLEDTPDLHSTHYTRTTSLKTPDITVVTVS